MNQPVLKSVQIRDVTFGKNVTVINPSNLYECQIGDDCFVGPFVEIQKGVMVGKRTRIQSHVFICEMVTIGDDCFISHGTKFINDTFQSGAYSRKCEDWKPTKIGNGVLIGTNATIMPVTICDRVVIGAGSVVLKNIETPGIYAGNPAKKIKDLS